VRVDGGLNDDAVVPSHLDDCTAYVAVMARNRLYLKGVLEREDFPVEEISEALDDPSAVVWLDLCHPSEEELHAITVEFGLHELAVEDAVHPHERPKLDRYDTHLFLSAYDVVFDESVAVLKSTEVAVFVMHRALITVRKNEGFDIEAVVKRWDASAELATEGVAFLLYGLLDVLVDGHFTAVQSLDDAIETLEDVLFDDRRMHVDVVQRRSFELRKSLVLLRRVVLPMREVVNALLRRDLHVVNDRMAPYYQDIYDHVLRATEWTESLRDLVNSILETNITIQGNRMNLIMKKVTSWAAIIAVPTAITGFYGQNLPYPGFGHDSGLYTSLGLIVGIGVVLYVAFKRWEWL
jgi:magnesium transporter